MDRDDSSGTSVLSSPVSLVELFAIERAQRIMCSSLQKVTLLQMADRSGIQ